MLNFKLCGNHRKDERNLNKNCYLEKIQKKVIAKFLKSNIHFKVSRTAFFLRFSLLGLFSLLCQFSICQKQSNNWFFGNRAGINFNSGTAVFQAGNLTASEGCSSISDSVGTLLFSTNGTTVWNRNNAVMGIIGPSGIASSSQAALIVPQPGNDSIYYVFISAQIEFTTTKGLFYGIINMNMNGGLGGIMQGYTTLYSNHIHEKIAAVKHKNGNDIWVLSHIAGTNEFLEYKVTSAGLNMTPTIIASGGTTDGFLDRMGYLKFSSDGSRIAMACAETRLELFKFDTETGAITDPKVIPKFPNTNCRGFYGAEFSCDSKLLYTSYFYLCSSASAMCYLLQYKVDFTDVNDIINSKVILDSSISSNYNYGALQMSPEGKILISMSPKNYIGAITNPNIYGLGCNFIPQYLSFPASANCNLGLPNMIQSYYNLNPFMSISGNCFSTNVSFDLKQLNLYDSLRWDFGDPMSGSANSSTLANPSHLFSATGFYYVKAFVYTNCKTDTLLKLISVGSTNSLLGNDTSLCPGAFFTKRINIPGATYLWQNGSVADSFKIQTPGIYWVKIMLGNCVSTDSITITGKPLPIFNLGSDTSICENTSLLLDITGSGDTYLWQDNSTLPVYNVIQAGNYFVKVTKDGCSLSDSIRVNVNQIPKPNLGADSTYCTGLNLILKPGIFTGSYLWQDGSTTVNYIVLQEGLYRVLVTNNCGTGSDEVNIKFKDCNIYFPSAFTPNNDRKNDVFNILNATNLQNYSLAIYNRYGQKVFETNNYLNGWDGKHNGKDVVAGAYIWKCSYTKSSYLELMKGTVILIR